jgi:hypothetical protein
VVRALSFSALLLIAAHAPYQCGRAPDPSTRREETAGEALYDLAQQRKAKGDDAGYRATLEFLIERYPSSRFAEAAKVELGRDREK